MADDADAADRTARDRPEDATPPPPPPAAPGGGAGGGGDAGDAGNAPPPDRDAVRTDVRRVAAREDTATPPTRGDYDARGEWRPAVVVRVLGAVSWRDALAAVDGVDADRDRGRPRAAPAALRRDLRRVAAREDTATPPTRGDYDARGRWAAQTVANRLGDGSWADALDAAGLDGGAARRRGCDPTPRDALRRDLRRVAARGDTADPPTTEEYDRHGEWAATTAARRLGGDGQSWGDALDAAGLDGGGVGTRRGRPGGRRGGAAPDALRDDLRRVAARDDTRDPPSMPDHDRHGEWAATTVVRRLPGESWADALDAAGLDGDAARERASGGRDGADPDALRADLRRVADRPDARDLPTMAEYDAHGEWSSTTVARHLGDGSWTDALRATGLADGDTRDGAGD